MKIAMLTFNYFPLTGGAEVFVRETARFLAGKGHKVDIITGRYDKNLPKYEIADDVNVYRVSYITGITGLTFATYLLSMLRTIYRLNRKEPYDLVHTIAEAPTSQVGTLFKKLKKKPHMITIQGGYLQKRNFGKGPQKWFLKTLIKWSFSNADLVHTISQMLAKEAKNLKAKHIIVLPNGVRGDIFKPKSMQEVRKKLNIPLEEKVIITVSRLIPRKGVDKIIKAFSRVSRNYPNLRLIIVGDGIQKVELEKLAKKVGVKNRVNFMGFIPHEKLGDILPAADVFALTPEYEGLGIVFIEALACGVPVVASRVGGIPDIVENGENGFLIPPGDIEQLSEALRTLLFNDSLRSKFRDGGLKTVNEKFLWGNILSRVEELYISLARKI